MALDYGSVKDMYDQLQSSGVVTKSLPEWSAEMNQLTGSDLYSAGLHDNILKRASHGLDKLIEATGIPQATGEFGQSVGEAVGAPEAGQKIGAGAGRMLLNFAPMLIPGAGWLGTAARLGGTALLSGTQTYEETGSPAAGLLSGATAAALPKVADIAEQAGLKALGGRLIEGQLATKGGAEAVRRFFPETIGQKVGGAVAGQLGAASVMEAGQAGQAKLGGEPVPSPFTVENLLNLTLGQAPFALIHLGGRGLGLGKTPEQRADILQHGIDVSAPVIEARRVAADRANMTPMEQVPDVEQPEIIPPKVLAETQATLAKVRGEQVAIKDDPALTPEQKFDATNKLLQQDYDLSKQNQPVGGTVFGNSILPDAPRQEVIGRQLKGNDKWRAIQVSDDPSNPEELRGKIVAYSTKNEPAPVFGFQTQETGNGKFSLPDPQWQTVKTQEEWDSRFPQKVTRDPNQPDLPVQTEPATDAQIRAHLVDLQKVETETKVAQTPADLQQAVVHLQDVENENNIPPTNDATLKRTAAVLDKSGLVDPEDIPQVAVIAQTKRTARKLDATRQVQHLIETGKIDPEEADRVAEVLVGKKPKEPGKSAPSLTAEEAANISAKMGAEPDEVANRGFSIISRTGKSENVDKLATNSTPLTVENQPIRNIVEEAAYTVTHPSLKDKPEDVQMFRTLVGQVGKLSDIGPDEIKDVAQFISDRDGTPVVEAKDEITHFLTQPHAKVWSAALEDKVVQMRQTNAAPISGTNPNVLGIPKAFSTIGQKDIALIDDQSFRDKITSGMQGAPRMVDAFSGSGVESRFARWAGYKGEIVENTIPVKGAILERIKSDPTFAQKADILGKQIAVLGNDYGAIKRTLLDAPDKDVALFVANNSSQHSREITDLSQYNAHQRVQFIGKLRNLGDTVNQLRDQIGTVTTEDGWKSVADSKTGEFVRVDPPYIGQKQYAAGQEDINLQTAISRVNDVIKPAAERGVKIMYTNAWSPELAQSLTDAGFNVEKMQRRGATPEVVATNYDVTSTGVEAPVNFAAKAKLEGMGYVVKQTATGENYATNKNGSPVVYRSGDQVDTLVKSLSKVPPLRRDAPIYVPDRPDDIAMVNKLGLPQGGRGMLNFLANHSNPFYQALASDLSKFGDSLDRISGVMRDIGSGAFTNMKAGGNAEITLSPSALRLDEGTQGFYIAHELIHGLSRNELVNPSKAGIVANLDSLRQRLIDNLPVQQRTDLKSALTPGGWYDQFISGQKRDLSGLFPSGTTEQRAVSYALLNNDELLAQGFSSKATREYMQSIKSPGGGTWFSRFTNTVKQLLGIGEKIPNTAFEEFLSHSDQLMEQGDYVSSFRNFSDRYFQNLGQSDQFVRYNTQRAMGLIQGSAFGTTSDELIAGIQANAGGIRSPEWSTAQRGITNMFNAKGDDAAVTMSVLDELGHSADQKGLTDFTHAALLGENHDAVDLLPPAAQNYLFETAKDTRNILGVIRAATLEGNKGVLNLVDPELIRGSAKDALAMVNKVTSMEQVQQEHVTTLQGLSAVSPDGYFDKMAADPVAAPVWVLDKPKNEIGAMWKFLAPVGQLARRIPEAAEALSRGWQLNANARKMATESLKAFATNLETMDFDKESVANVARTLSNPRLERAINQWIYTNQVEGKKVDAVTMLNSDHPLVQKILSGLGAKDQATVEDVINKHAISQQHMQSQILEKMLQTSSTNGAVIAQKGMGGGKLRDAVTLSDTMLRSLTADRTDPNAAQQADAQMSLVQQKMTPEGFLNLLKYSQNQADSWKTWQSFFDKNPAWSSGQRYGKFIAEYKRGGRSFLVGVDSKKELEQKAEGGVITRFEKNFKSDADQPPVLGPDSAGIVNRLKELEDNQIGMLQNAGVLSSADDIAQFKATSPVGQFATEEAYRGGVPGLTPPPRGLTKGAGELPWLSNHLSWVQKTSTYYSRQLLRAQARAHLLDPEVAQNDQLSSLLKTHYDNILQPDTATGSFMQKSAMTWFMGFNPASALINATQPFLTHVAELTSMSGKPLDSYRRTINALREVATKGVKGSWATPDHEWLIHQASQDGELDYSMFDDNAAIQESMATNYKRAMIGNRVQTLGQRLSTLAGNYSTVGMWMFKGVERINNQAALLSSFDYYRESQPHLSRDEAYTKAVEFNHAVNYGGGRAQRPIGVFAGKGAFPRTAAMLATSMQSYNLGTAFQLSRYIQAGLFRPAGLTPHEVYSARKAAVQMLGTQFAAAGVLGLPFVSGAIALLDKAVPDLEINRHLRETMASVFGQDKENGGILNDIAMTGVPSMIGWDLQSRLSMGNTVPGVSEINGFDPELLLGAPANLISTFVKGGQKLATGNFAQAADAFMPSALKKIEQFVRSGGQVKDYADRPIFQPTPGETMGIALGFQPKRLSDFNAANRIARQSQDNVTRHQNDFHQQQAEDVLKGSFGSVRQALLAKAQDDKTYNPVEGVKSVAKAATELTFPRDLRQEGTLRASDVRSRLLSTFRLDPTQPSEVARLQFQTQVQQRLGLMASSSKDLQMAQMMDALRRQNPEATRADLKQQASLLFRGPRLQTLGEPQE